MGSSANNVKRVDFIRQFMRNGGLSYEQATHAYTALMLLLENAVTQGHKISLGNLGSITPVLMPPRIVAMGFRRGKGRRIEMTQQRFSLPARITWKFNLYRQFRARQRST